MKSTRRREGQLYLIVIINLQSEQTDENGCKLDVNAVFLWLESSLYLDGFENLKMFVIWKRKEHSHGSPATKDKIEDLLFQK